MFTILKWILNKLYIISVEKISTDFDLVHYVTRQVIFIIMKGNFLGILTFPALWTRTPLIWFFTHTAYSPVCPLCPSQTATGHALIFPGTVAGTPRAARLVGYEEREKNLISVQFNETFTFFHLIISTVSLVTGCPRHALPKSGAWSCRNSFAKALIVKIFFCYSSRFPLISLLAL